MAQIERHKLDGQVEIILRKPGGATVQRMLVRNLITTTGRMLLAELLVGTMQVQSTDLSIVIGTSATAATPADTALGKQVDMAPGTVGALRTTTGDTGPTVVATVGATFPPRPAGGDTQPIREAGILIGKPGAAPILYNHVTFPEINRSGSLELSLSWEVIF